MQYIISYFSALDPDKLVTVSASSVLHEKTQTPDGGSEHVEQLTRLVRHLADLGYHVLLVPHTYRPNRPDPCACDLATSQLVLNKLGDVSHLELATEDLSPIELKSIISCAQMHIGARYHSIVAALSAGVPCISLSWHPKYRDIMRVYGVEAFVVDGTSNRATQELFQLFERLRSSADAIRPRLKECQTRAAARVEENTRVFFEHMIAAPK
jgi:polysaccharide pyruvyl transferase WcaK-like protein